MIWPTLFGSFGREGTFSSNQSIWTDMKSCRASQTSEYPTTTCSFPLCVAVALASAAPEVSVPGRISSQCSTALRTNLPVCLSWPWLTQAQPTWLTPDTNEEVKSRPQKEKNGRHCPQVWTRVASRPHRTSGRNRRRRWDWLILSSFHLMLLTSASTLSPSIAIHIKPNLLILRQKKGSKICWLTSIGVTLVGGMFYLWTHCYRARITSSAPAICNKFKLEIQIFLKV